MQIVVILWWDTWGKSYLHPSELESVQNLVRFIQKSHRFWWHFITVVSIVLLGVFLGMAFGLFHWSQTSGLVKCCPFWIGLDWIRSSPPPLFLLYCMLGQYIIITASAATVHGCCIINYHTIDITVIVFRRSSFEVVHLLLHDVCWHFSNCVAHPLMIGWLLTRNVLSQNLLLRPPSLIRPL